MMMIITTMNKTHAKSKDKGGGEGGTPQEGVLKKSVGLNFGRDENPLENTLDEQRKNRNGFSPPPMLRQATELIGWAARIVIFSQLVNFESLPSATAHQSERLISPSMIGPALILSRVTHHAAEFDQSINRRRPCSEIRHAPRCPFKKRVKSSSGNQTILSPPTHSIRSLLFVLSHPITPLAVSIYRTIFLVPCFASPGNSSKGKRIHPRAPRPPRSGT